MGEEADRASERATAWWGSPAVLSLAVLATAIPLLWPQIPPLVDLPGHIGRYRVELDLAHSPLLQRYYDFHWALMGNLGVDVLVLGLAPVFGLELTVKLIVLLIPPLTAAGYLLVAHEVHGRVPPTAFLALPFVYSFPFLFGFVNFALSAALAFLAFALWLRLATTDCTSLRLALFVPISFLIFFCHVYGLGLLGLMCFSAEVVRQRASDSSWPAAMARSVLAVAPLGIPLLVMLVWAGGSAGGATAGWFDWDAKWTGLYGVLRDRWGPFDVATVELVALGLLFAIISPKLRSAPAIALSAILLALCFLLLPRFIMGSAYADVRILHCLFPLAVLAVDVRRDAGTRFAQIAAMFAIAVFAIRLSATTGSLAMAATDQQAKLDALNVIPRGARVVSLYTLPYAEPWALQRDSHLGGLVIARREGFSNDQWIVESLNLLRLRYGVAGSFGGDPSQVVRPNGTHDGVYRTIDEALAQIPRDRFDYVWLLNPAQFDPRLAQGLQPVWRGQGSVLYRIAPSKPANE